MKEVLIDGMTAEMREKMQGEAESAGEARAHCASTHTHIEDRVVFGCCNGVQASNV